MVCGKVIDMIEYIASYFDSKTQGVMLTLYDALVQPYLEYTVQ